MLFCSILAAETVFMTVVFFAACKAFAIHESMMEIFYAATVGVMAASFAGICALLVWNVWRRVFRSYDKVFMIAVLLLPLIHYSLNNNHALGVCVFNLLMAGFAFMGIYMLYLEGRN